MCELLILLIALTVPLLAWLADRDERAGIIDRKRGHDADR